MTKLVRVENADNSQYKVAVEIWDIVDGEEVLSRTVLLDHPTFMIGEYLTSTRFFKVKEVK